MKEEKSIIATTLLDSGQMNSLNMLASGEINHIESL